MPKSKRETPTPNDLDKKYESLKRHHAAKALGGDRLLTLAELLCKQGVVGSIPIVSNP